MKENYRQFEKISEEQFNKDIPSAEYSDIKLPERSTSKSAGYDFYILDNYTINPGEKLMIPTGVKARLNDFDVLLLFIRSSLATKKRLQLSNNVGVIDADYYNNSDNEGHIWVAVTNTGNEAVHLDKGSKICQGIILQYATVLNDEASGERSGGFGSTGK